MMNIDKVVREDIELRLGEYENFRRRAVSARWPIVQPVTIGVRRWERGVKNYLERDLQERLRGEKLPKVIAYHQSVLVRQLGESEMHLQYNKITNLKLAVQKLDGLIIEPGKTFSFWEAVGNPVEKEGFVKGMLLAEGKIVEGVGGGLCQLSNFLFWILIHCDVQIIERHHHAFDVFPDSGRVLPFGSGATILYNYIDLKIKNISDQPLQLELWLTDKYLRGRVRANRRPAERYHIVEREHVFVKHKDRYFRYNQIWRETYVSGQKVKEEKIVVNFAPVVYGVTDDYLAKLGYEVVDL